MAISSWMIRNRSLRSKGRPPPEDCYRLDGAKNPSENAYDIYLSLSSRMTNENKRLSLLNGLVKLIVQSKGSNVGFTSEEFFYCVSASLTHQFTQIRAASLRALRHLIMSPKDIQIFNGLQLPHLVCRSLDILLKNEEERVQALKLIRRMLAISPENVSPVLVRCLVSLGESGVEDGDRMLRACLATLCEFGVLNPTLMIMCGGVGALTRNVLECHSPRIAESLCGVLLHLLEWPHTRNIAGVRLDCLAAPYCDFTYRLGIMDKHKDARDLRFTCSRLALLSVLRSWAGILEFCNPTHPSGLKAIVDVLYLNQLEVRKAILDLLYELLGLPQPVWTDEYTVALSVVDPADFQDSWRLSEGFVAMEGRFVLPTLASRVPNVCEIHLAVLLYCFIETGLLNALVEVIVSSDTFISVRATVLLGKLLQLMHSLLPADICSNSPALPTLISKATEGNHLARAAVAALQSYHQLLKNRPASCSLFLDNIIQTGRIINTKIFRRELNSHDSLTFPIKFGTLERIRHDSVGSTITSTTPEPKEEMSSSSFLLGIKRTSFKRTKILHIFDGFKESERMLRLSNVLLNQDGSTWDWDIIVAILKSDILNKLDDSHIKFIKKLVHFFKPSSNRFSHQDLGHGRHIPPSVVAGVELIEWLLHSTQELEPLRMLTDLFSDINNQLLSISTSRSAHECLFSPQHMSSTMCQQYFLFIGRMCKTEKGINVLKNTNVFNQLNELVGETNHVCYIKLSVSGLDYTLDSFPREILRKALVLSKLRPGRLYATQFLLILLRAKIPNFEIWGLPLLVNQVKDMERSVVLAALEILDEACHDQVYLDHLVTLWPDLDEVGDAGKLIMSRFYSIPKGLVHAKANLKSEIEFWKNEYNRRYVLLIEADTHASMTLHYKNEDGTYNRRSCSSRPTIIPPNILPHLYGQLVQTSQGMSELQKYGNLLQLIEYLNVGKCHDEAESLVLKSALWALGHVSTSTEGVEFLNDPMSRVYEKIIYMAKHCEIYSIRSTALNVLGLIGSTNAGANILYKLDWFCVRHDRNTYWPVCEPEDWLSKHLSPMRHQIGEVPPYNYTGIEDSEFFSDGSNSFYFDEPVVENSRESGGNNSGGGYEKKNNGEIRTTDRSKTLPESSILQKRRHTGSLSESKTTDGLSLLTATQYQSARTRVNSGTDSNTSGVSSCDSIFGKIFISDLQQTTLSPIPSSSNLLEIKKPSEERFRRISLTGVPLRENTLSPQDLQGYATLRSLRRHCRPMLSESAADELAEIIDSDNITIRNKKQITSEQQRKLKVRSLDGHTRLLTAGVEEFQSSNSSTATNTASRLQALKNETKGPCYTGICLPKNILDLFPHRNLNISYISRCNPDLDTLDSGNLSVLKQQFLNDSIIEGDESCVSSLSDISTNSKKSKWAGKHNRMSCLYCCRSKVNRMHPRTDSDINIPRRKSNHSSSIQLSDVSFNSPESVFSEESMPDRITANILRHVQRMSNPVWSKQSKMSLLELKQKHPVSFQDICLYSEVCKLLGRCTYRLNARRFLQELFLDLDFDSFFNEANEIVIRKETINPDNLSINDFDSDNNSLTSQSSQTQFQRDIAAGGSAAVNPLNSIESTNVNDIQQQQQVQTNLSLLKSHLKSPPLESVYEASAENLSESFGTKNSNFTATKPSSCNLNRSNSSNNNNNSNNNLNSNQKILFNYDNYNNRNENYKYRRPRFHTLEFDLSCTKNKFPITERRKNFSPTLSSGGGSSGIFSQSFTKSLSSSVTTPTGSLYCEKRLQLSKSEATLSKSSGDDNKN